MGVFILPANHFLFIAGERLEQSFRHCLQYSEYYFVYITCNPGKKVLYTGVTNDLKRRLTEHYQSKGKPNYFASKYYCYKLLYYETYDSSMQAIYREKEIKDLIREKKINLIMEQNPGLNFLSF